MRTTSIPLSISALAILAACGGGGTSATDENGIRTGPLTGAEIEATLNDVASAAGSGTSIVDLLAFDTETDDITLDALSPRDLTAGGSASYTGIVVLSDVDVSGLVAGVTPENVLNNLVPEEAADPTFAVLGRSEMQVTFGADPEVSGGANGFIGLNFETLDAIEEPDLGENPDVETIVAALPTVDVPGSLTYSGGTLIDIDTETDLLEDLGVGFDVSGSVTLTGELTGNASDQTLTVDGEGFAGFVDPLALGVMDLGSTGGENSITVGGAFIGVAD